jgi:RNA polymerase sigma factor (sigma-70 family)
MTQTTEAFYAVARQHVGAMSRFARHEIAQLEAVGDLLRGELAPQDIVDATLLRASREYAGDPDPRQVTRAWLLRLAREQVEAEVAALKAERDTAVRIEDDVPETPPAEQAATQGESILYFYEPEEDWKVEDVVPDLKVPTPEQEVETRELRSCLRTALADLPPAWRRALMLHHLDALDGAELAEAVGLPEHELPQVLDQARRRLRRKLVESGCEFTSPA